ncbi:MAG: F0F1 ATP synthase subunit epsilon [Planctomycetota bacterium]
MADAHTKILGGHLNLSIVTPEAAAYDGPADLIVVPGHDGEVAFLPGHAPFVGLLGAGELRAHVPEGGTKRFFLVGGVVQVAAGEVSVLAESVTPVEALDLTKARVELEAAIARKGGDDEAEASRDRAILTARAKVRLAEHVAGGAPAHAAH